MRLKFHTEAYRSGHNGTDSKSVVPHGTVGSNPTASANKAEIVRFQLFLFYMLYKITLSEKAEIKRLQLLLF